MRCRCGFSPHTSCFDSLSLRDERDRATMTSNNILVGQILIVMAIIVAGVWIATQWTAAHLGYQSRLGSAWFLFARVPVYYPWRLFEWWYAYEAYAPQVFNRGGM